MVQPLLLLTKCFTICLKVPQVCSVNLNTEVLSDYFKNSSYNGREVLHQEEQEFLQKNSGALVIG